MKRMLLVSSFLLYITVLHAQLKEDFSPNPTGWTLSQGAKFEKINGNDIIITPGVGGNNPAVIGTPVVNKTSNTVY
jgi:N-acetylmuramoyl-L-alanine amidase